MSTSEFWKEIDLIKSMMHTISRDMAIAGIAGQSSGGGGNKGPSNSAIKALIRQEIERKVDEDRLNEVLVKKADISELREIINRQNNLESYVHKTLNQKGKTDHDITNEMIKRDEENQTEDRGVELETLEEMETQPFNPLVKKQLIKQQI